MPTVTKRELREQRRAERQAAEPAGAPALPAAAASACSAASPLWRRSSSPSPRSLVRRPPPRRQARRSSLLAGIPERDGVLGDPKAKVTVTEFLDLQYPICAEASKQTLPTIVNDYVRTGKVKLEARTLHFLGPDSDRAAQRGRRRRGQGKLWPFVEAFYAAQGQENSGYVTDDFLREVANRRGLDAEKASTQRLPKQA